jgi:hypothetical protein
MPTAVNLPCSTTKQQMRKSCSETAIRTKHNMLNAAFIMSSSHHQNLDHENSQKQPKALLSNNSWAKCQA